MMIKVCETKYFDIFADGLEDDRMKYVLQAKDNDIQIPISFNHEEAKALITNIQTRIDTINRGSHGA